MLRTEGIENITKLKAPPIYLRNYLVPCIFHKEHWIPIIGPRHHDKELGQLEQYHWHVDLRFISKYEILILGHSPADLLSGRLGVPVIFATPGRQFRKVVRPCLRQFPSQPVPLGRRVFWTYQVEESLKDKGIDACRKCPHKGFPLGSTPVRDGMITCPGHALKFDAETGKLIRTVKYNNNLGCFEPTEQFEQHKDRFGPCE